ncbi:PREDICTED: uncharacterized protein LOC109471958 [Branchiostoma belcheri]|uniref:Uncharacterized protein LOC109471958 n=1 Tax=Branchiostoma belcheri TaxID=7741 RepID=A0A6P4YRQ9_BRABE|nr:PREDICTED: uncharacterized protein LOC109471958 [Branchiostoma belcheri]KAI8508145.1 hypothetical protein Bbelb_143850 [Branchiostoma belcheri]
MAAAPLFAEIELVTRPGAPMTDCLDWLFEHHLLASRMECLRCDGHVEMEYVERRDVSDNFTWRCPRQMCRTSRSVRTDSIFAEFPKIDLRVFLRFIVKWVEGKLVKDIAEELLSIGYVSMHTLCKMCRVLRQVCENKLVIDPPIPMGGENTVLVMDESVFRKKPKYRRGRRARPIWVFGIVRTDVQPCIGYMEVVESRDANTLLPIIERCVLPGSTIYSDEWAAYRRVQDLPNVAQHRTVNHSRHFVDPVTGVHTQHIESYWNRKKKKLKAMHGCMGEDTASYLKEEMWRERYARTSREGLQNVLADIAQQYQV